jgi:hypothetical protein
MKVDPTPAATARATPGALQCQDALIPAGPAAVSRRDPSAPLVEPRTIDDETRSAAAPCARFVLGGFAIDIGDHRDLAVERSETAPSATGITRQGSRVDAQQTRSSPAGSPVAEPARFSTNSPPSHGWLARSLIAGRQKPAPAARGARVVAFAIARRTPGLSTPFLAKRTSTPCSSAPRP